MLLWKWCELLSRTEKGEALNLLAENVGTSLRMIETNYAKFLAKARRKLIEATSPKLRRVK